MNITQVLPNVLHIQFDSITEMSASLGRVQEFAENPTLHNQVVSWSRLKKYHKSKGNTRTFNAAWLGFNIPGSAFTEFYEQCTHFKPKEKSKGLLQVIPDNANLICFHGKPRIRDCEVAWVKDYVNEIKL